MNIKKAAGLLLAFIIAAFACFPVFAAEESAGKQKVEVTLDTIPNIMEKYNSDIKSISNSRKIAEDKYKDAKDDDDVTDSTKDYYKTQYKIANAQYNAKVSGQILSAKKEYLNYCADNVELTALKTDYNNKQAKIGYYNSALINGYVSQEKYDDYKQSADEAKDDYDAQNAKVTRERAELKTLLDIPSGYEMDIVPVADSAFDFSAVSNINYNKDVVAMVNSDPNIQAAGLEYDNTDDDSSSDFEIENAKITLEQTEQSEKTAFKKLYDTLMTSYSTYQSELQKYQQAKQKADTENKKAALGYASQESADSMNLQMKNEENTYFTARNSLYMVYLQYSNMKNGLGSITE